MDGFVDRVSDGKEEWLTPPDLIKALGEFDLDPCAPVDRPWDTARKHYTIEDDGLVQAWEGRVFCNPPYGTKTGLWLNQMACHQNGIALIFARTETGNFFNYIWEEASGILFLKGRLKFHHRSGEIASNCAAAPSCLVSYGGQNYEAMEIAVDKKLIIGKLIKLTPTWISI